MTGSRSLLLSAAAALALLTSLAFLSPAEASSPASPKSTRSVRYHATKAVKSVHGRHAHAKDICDDGDGPFTTTYPLYYWSNVEGGWVYYGSYFSACERNEVAASLQQWWGVQTSP
jgi:hypothetical protein